MFKYKVKKSSINTIFTRIQQIKLILDFNLITNWLTMLASYIIWTLRPKDFNGIRGLGVNSMVGKPEGGAVVDLGGFQRLQLKPPFRTLIVFNLLVISSILHPASYGLQATSFRYC